ncbi:MAG: UrcA family protein [Terricaulis sp.]
MTRLLSVLCFAAALTAAPGAFADPGTPPAVTVRSQGLDLSSEAGARTVLRRIDQAADRVCGASIARQYPSTRRTFEACHRGTMARTVAQLGAPRVSEQYALRPGAQRADVAGR